MPAALVLVFFGVALVLAAPSRGQQPAAEAFTRDVQPLAVYDSTGAPLRFPFLGGLNRPRPQFVDIDADGDLDLFVQERAGRVLFFENESDGPAPLTDAPFEERLALRSTQYRGLDVGQWFRFADMDADGDFDLLAEQPISYVRYLQNTGTPAEASFSEAADTLRTVGSMPIFADRRNRPATVPSGCSGGSRSLFFGGLDGRLRFFRGEGVGPDGVPRLRFVSDRYEGVCAGPPSVCGFGSSDASGGRFGREAAAREAPRPTARHGANALSAGDLDGDGDADLLWGDFFSESFYRIENETGSSGGDDGDDCDGPSLRLTSDVFPLGDPVQTAGFNVSDLADLEGDGDADLVFGILGGSGAGAADAVENLYLLRRTADGFVTRTRRLLTMIDVGGESVPAFADLDADGDADLVVGSEQPGDGAALSFFENTSDAMAGDAAVFRQRPVVEAPFAALPAGFSTHPAFADLDADGDMDLALGTFGGLTLYENTGTPAVPQFAPAATLSLPALPPGNYFAPTFADLDADGAPDLLVGSSGGTLTLLRNTGTSAAPEFTLDTDRFADLDVGGRSAPAFRDADGDGDLDLYVGARAGLRFYENTGTPEAPRFAPPGTPAEAALALPTLATPAFAGPGAGADLDGDRRADLIAGGESGGLFFYAGQLGDGRPPEEAVRPVQAAPNPFRTETTLSFRLAEAARVRLSLYDMRGRRMAVLFEGQAESGREVRVPLRAGSLASGVYLFRLTRPGGDVLDTGSVVLVR